jgi:uncharacterized membrane protein YdbT with pleckstrin-like domain
LTTARALGISLGIGIVCVGTVVISHAYTDQEIQNGTANWVAANGILVVYVIAAALLGLLAWIIREILR